MEMTTAINALDALAQETRLGVFRLLVRAGHAGATPGQIAAALGVPAPTLSFHLMQLSHAGLVERRRAGRTLHYRIDIAQVRALLAYLMEDCCRGLPVSPGPDTEEAAVCYSGGACDD